MLIIACYDIVNGLTTIFIASIGKIEL